MVLTVFSAATVTVMSAKIKTTKVDWKCRTGKWSIKHLHWKNTGLESEGADCTTL